MCLGERECSVQRRYQKIIEESPSPFINQSLREKLYATSIKITKACNYSGAGTMEFLVDKHKDYYFLEMNTRLQVEHPVTEMTTGLDLVKEQIHVANGNPLSFSQNDINPQGHSIECRIYAEDGFNNFAPSIGTIHELSFPQGLGVRMDDGVRQGQEVSPYYDPLLGKLITWGNDRHSAMQRMKRALREFHVAGIETSIPFCLMFIQHKLFEAGNYSTQTLNEIKDELHKKLSIHKSDRLIAAGVGAILKTKNKAKSTTTKNVENKQSNWSNAGRKENLR